MVFVAWALTACAAGGEGPGATTATSSTSASSGGAAGAGGMGGQGGSLIANGDPCDGASKCESGYCVDGRCCDAACAGLCQSCNVTDSEGICSPVPADTDPDDECGGLGCDGAGACAYGKHLWSHIYGGLGEEVVLDATVDPSGNFIVCGYVESDIDFGGGVLSAHGLRDIFIAKLDDAGMHVWSKVLGETTGSSSQTAHGCTTDSQGRVIVVGDFSGAVNFGGGSLSGAGDAFVAVYDASGNHVWSKAFPHGGTPLSARAAHDVRADANDDLVILGEFTGNMSIDGNIVDDGPGGQKSLFLAKLTDTGTHLWSMAIGTAAAEDEAGEIALTPTGNVVLAASMEGTVSFGSTNHTSAGGFDVLLAKLDANGNHIWSKRFGDASAQHAHGLTLDASGNVLLTGAFQGELNFGGGTLTSAGGFDIFLAAFDEAGVHLWDKALGSGDDQLGLRVAVDAQGDVILTGSMKGSTDFGGGTHTSSGAEDIFLVKLASDGSHRWSKRYGEALIQRPAALAVTSQDRLFLAAYAEDSVDFGGGALESAGQEDVTAALLGP
jgi:hypothetical protein